MWREKKVEHRIGEYVGQYSVIVNDMMSKNVLVQKGEGSKYKKNCAASVKPCTGDEHEELKNSTDAISTNCMKHLYQAFIDFKTPSEVLDIRLNEAIQPDDPRAKDHRMARAIQGEVLTARYSLAIKSTIDG